MWYKSNYKKYFQGKNTVSIYDELALPKLINAVGTYTVVGGSRMSEETLRDLCDAARSFVEVEKLQDILNRKVAELTRNEAALLCNSCSCAIYLATAACVARHYGKNFNLLTAEEISRCEVVALWGQHIPYDHAMEQLGVKIRFVGFPNMQAELPASVIKDAINSNTVMCYFAPRTPDGYYGEGCMNLSDFIAAAHSCGIPVLADGAAQLPPKHNLWRYTRDLGADMACFSGGKDLAGPQASGLLLGSAELLKIATELSFPRYGCGRIMKIGREEMVALYSAIRQYVNADETARLKWCETEVAKLVTGLENCKFFSAERTWPNQAGQPLPRAFVTLKHDKTTPAELREILRTGEPGIICYSENRPGVYINPMCLADGEMEQIITRFKEIDKQLQ